ncbi:BTB/POZ domain-containing protein 3-like isoform X1 [Malaya genurostris]|uniref:BTB/POZ domain-containing protein 3-like isoform X1 n=1 Tax=Malaya genurostris TaxID=325434 RepID=UPI0026F3B8A0|nr:BTB/POZ domain-containing protein 3-like isoform X1 [Malaya genurostris]XP_058446294.1 BTB/POZ domain-containing protein 3-like isoform X1 [Malaya genurostris]
MLQQKNFSFSDNFYIHSKMTEIKKVHDDYRREVLSRMQFLLDTTKWTDCQFLVGQEPNIETFDAHKLILSLASPVFETMFHGALAEPGNVPIRIVDVKPEVFRKLLQYMYTDKINPDSFDVFMIYLAAQKYMLSQAKEQCIAYLAKHIDLSNVFDLYDFATFHDEPVLIQSCQSVMIQRTDELLRDPSFLDIKLSTFIMILNQKNLNISSELYLFKALKAYAIKHGLTRTDHSNQENDQSIDSAEGSPGEKVERMKLNPKKPTIDDALYRIRFLTLPPQELAPELIATNGLLTLPEIGAILMNCSMKRSDFPIPPGFSNCRKRRVPVQCVVGTSLSKLPTSA